MEVAEAGAETATLQNGKVEQQVTIEDCPEAGDVDTTVTIKLTKQPAAAVTAASDDASDEEVEEEIIEVVEGDADGDTVEVTETVQVVKQEEVAAPKTTTTVTVIKKQDGSVGDANTTTTTTTTTVVRKASVAESAPDATATADEPTNTQTTTTVKKTITTTAATPTPTPTQTSAAVIEKKEVVVDPPKQQQAAEVVQEVEEEEEEEEEVEDEEEEEAEDAKDDGDVVAKTNGSSIPTTKSQNEAEPATAPAAAPEAPSEKEAVAAPVTAVAAPVDAARQEHEQQKQDNLNNTIKEIISDLDRDIEQQEDVAKLKAQQMELLKQQQALAQQIRQQQLLSQQLAAQNKLQEQQLQQQQHYQPQQATKAAPAALAAPGTVSKSTTIEESQHENGFTRKNESYEVEESSNVSKRIDLQKIFTPATDAEEILPKNRKLYASSAFYSPSLHPTVEDQVELARRISHSLSDISNHQSKGQSMYVNRKKRSVKWVHEGAGKAKKDTSLLDYECEETSKENTDIYNNDVSTATTSTTSTTTSTGQLPLTKVPLKLVMNPRGQIRDFNSVRESLNTETGLMSPDKCAELVTALNTQKGKGAELFAKRRRKAEKWVVDETNAGTQSPSGLPDYHQYQPRPPTSPSIVPAYSDAGKHRVQLNMHQEQMLEKYAKPGLKVVKTPWEAALETGSASAAFVEEHKLSPYSNQATPTISPAPAPLYLDNRAPSPYPAVSSTDAGSYADFAPQPYQQQTKLPQTQYQPSKPTAYNSQRDLAYKPNIAQGWKAPSMTLPKELYVPKEIPLESYAPPPAVSPTIYNKPSAPITDSYNWSPTQAAYEPSSYPATVSATTQQYPSSYPSYSSAPQAKPQSSFPLSKNSAVGGIGGGYSSTYAPPKQPHLPPNSYQTVQQLTGQAPQVSFNPSPLPYDKLAKFENPPPPEISSPRNLYSPYRALGVSGAGSRVRNVSPSPYGARPTSGASQVYPPALSPQAAAYGNGAAGAASPNYGTPGSSRPPSQQFSSYGATQGYENGSSCSNYRPSTADLAHCQNFNNAARGWGSGRTGTGSSQNGAGYRNTKSVAAAGLLPYSDF